MSRCHEVVVVNNALNREMNSRQRPKENKDVIFRVVNAKLYRFYLQFYIRITIEYLMMQLYDCCTHALFKIILFIYTTVRNEYTIYTAAVS